ncbi:MAG: hypothetical protein R3F62_22720 [Planctomycetota bacterium]
MNAPGWLLLAPLAWAILWLLERWRRRPLRVVVADLSLFPETAGTSAAPRASRRPSRAFWWRVAACGALALAAAGPRSTQRGRLDVDLVCDRGLESGFVVDGQRVLDWERAQLERVLARLEPRDRVHLSLVPDRGGVPPLSPADAARVLAQATPAAAAGDVRRAAQALPGQRPAFVASPAPLELEGLAQARWTARGPNRGVVALGLDTDGVEVALASDGLPSPCAVELRVSGDGGEATRTTPSSSPRAAPPAAAGRAARGPRASSRAARGPVARARRPGHRRPRGGAARAAGAGRPGLRPRPGGRARAPGRAGDRGRAGRPRTPRPHDLLVVDRLSSDAPLPPTAVVVVPTARRGPCPRPSCARPSTPRARSRTVDAVFAAPFRVVARSPLPALEGAHPLIQTAAGEPLVLVKGRGRALLGARGVPPRREATSWVDARAFPFFWAELVALASEARGQLQAVPAGTRVDGAPALDVGTFPPGEPRVGTVAALVPLREAAPPAPFAEADLAGLEAARPRVARSWGWAAFLLAAVCGALGLRAEPDPTRAPE